MKKSEWNEGLNHLDSDIIENHLEQKDILNHKKKLKGFWLRVGAVAACLAIICAVAVAPKILNPNPQTLIEVQFLKDEFFSAKNIADLFDIGRTDGIATNTYTTVCVPDAKYLYLNEIPADEYINIYEYKLAKKELNEQEFKEFTNDILANVAAALNINTPSYTVKKDVSTPNLSTFIIDDNHFLHATQNERFSTFSFSTEEDDEKLIIDGNCVQVDQRMSDEEIISSLGPIKETLFNIYGVSFSDVKIIRRYKDYEDNGVAYLYIYFYNKSDCAYNFAAPDSDYISILFDNSKNHPGDTVSKDVLTVADIEYHKYRSEPYQRHGDLYNANRLPLEEAEKLLYKGYVFGGHSCPLCMASQEKIDFEGYDYVGIEYILKSTQDSFVIPFYAFYKEIGTAENGYTIYAKTYVPAIKISGYEEYFESQKANHK